MEGFVWNDRFVRVRDGSFEVSAKGRHEDFDFSEYLDGEGAFSGTTGSRVLGVEKVDDRILKINAVNGQYLMVDDTGKSNVKSFRIQPYKPIDPPDEEVKPDVILEHGGEG